MNTQNLSPFDLLAAALLGIALLPWSVLALMILRFYSRGDHSRAYHFVTPPPSCAAYMAEEGQAEAGPVTTAADDAWADATIDRLLGGRK